MAEAHENLGERERARAFYERAAEVLAAALGPEACRLVLMPALDHFVGAAIDVDPTRVDHLAVPLAGANAMVYLEVFQSLFFFVSSWF